MFFVFVFSGFCCVFVLFLLWPLWCLVFFSRCFFGASLGGGRARIRKTGKDQLIMRTETYMAQAK